MELLLRNGDYVPDGRGALVGLTGGQEVLQRVLFRLQARRGALPFLPELGSQLYRLPREKSSARQAVAQRYVAQALEMEPEVAVKQVELTEQGDGRLLLTALLEWQGEPLTASVEI